MITTSQSTKSYVKQRWEAVLSDPNVKSDIIDNLYIEASDGWLRLGSCPHEPKYWEKGFLS